MKNYFTGYRDISDTGIYCIISSDNTNVNKRPRYCLHPGRPPLKSPCDNGLRPTLISMVPLYIGLFANHTKNTCAFTKHGDITITERMKPGMHARGGSSEGNLLRGINMIDCRFCIKIKSPSPDYIQNLTNLTKLSNFTLRARPLSDLTKMAS